MMVGLPTHICITRPQCVNLLAPGRCSSIFKYVLFKHFIWTNMWNSICEIVLIWIPMGLIDNKSALDQVMAWCHQATSHYLEQCWPSSATPYGVTRPQWVNSLRRHKIDAILQTTFSNAISSMKMFEFWLISRWSLFLKVQLTIFEHWFR